VRNKVTPYATKSMILIDIIGIDPARAAPFAKSFFRWIKCRIFKWLQRKRVYASYAGIVHEIAHEIAVEKERVVTKSFPFVSQRPKVSYQ
jgi:hypothetical protein